MIELKNVSKFYYNKGIIASGFSKVSLKLEVGEFVAITGESGSGKSTLLNVISGLDSYEEGEMYINGKETSHYTEKDFENYRRKYIGNIFQNFNLVNSYTVYQNIELVLLLNGNNKKDIKDKVISLIKRVNLYKFRNTKVSRLSGGQKQRVAIARALAKDTPIIIADEPTGNLDKTSAEGIIKLFSEIAKDKLVIIVTHNYEQVEKYVTRKIIMHDGKILEDKKIKSLYSSEKPSISSNYKNISFLNTIRLGIRNAFNIVPKFLLLLFVYLFITISIISDYASFKKQDYITKNGGSNNYFTNNSIKRIIIKKNDKTSFTEDDYKIINNIKGVKYVVKNDLLLDNQITVTDNNNLYLNGLVNPIAMISKVDVGRMPNTDNEIVIAGSKDDYYMKQIKSSLETKKMYIQNINDTNYDSKNEIKIVGIKYIKIKNYSYSYKLYLSDPIINNLTYQINQKYSTLKLLFQDKYYSTTEMNISPNYNVPQGKAYISSNLNSVCKNEYCINQNLKIEVNNLNYNDQIDLQVARTYNNKNFKYLLGLNEFDANNGVVFISYEDYNKLFDKGIFQSSVFVKDDKNIDLVSKKLNELNYSTLKIRDTLVTGEEVQILKIVEAIVTIALIITLFFISYFVIRIIMKSRNTYYATLRMLGATKTISKRLLIIELLTISNLAYFMFILFINYSKGFGLKIDIISTITRYLLLPDYIVLYIVLFIMSYLISLKYAYNLFKDSAMKTIREGK